MSIEKCPICHNHCPKDNLGCGRGKKYFESSNSDSEPKTLSEEVIMDLRKCGHFLHHNKELDSNKFLSVFSEEELNQLHKLLSKMDNID